MSQLCRAISILLILGVSTLEVKQTPTHISPSSVEEAHERLKLKLGSQSLDKFGSKAFSSDAKQPADANPSGGTGSVLLPHFLSAHFATSSSLTQSGSDMSIVLIWVFIALLFVGVWAGCMPPDPYDEASEADAERKEATAKKMPPVIESVDGFWANKYRESYGENREALALLLRCNVVEQEELADSDVSQEHVEECLWIAKTMLQERPLEEWVALSHDDRQWFQDSVAAVFEARARVQAVEAAQRRGRLSARVAERSSLKSQSLQQDSSTVSLGSTVSFSCDQEEHVGSLPVFQHPSRNSNQLPFKSPVPIMNCGDAEDDVSSEGSTNAGQMEDVFPSVFSSFTSPPISQFSSPQESQKAPGSPYEPSSLRLPPRERVRFAPGVSQSSSSEQKAFAVLPVSFTSPRSPMGSSHEPLGFRSLP